MVSTVFVRAVLLLALFLNALCLPAPSPLEKGECAHQHRHHNSCSDDPSNTETKGVSPELLGQMHVMSEYAAAAYLPANYNSTGTPLSCSGTCPGKNGGSCPQVEVAGAATIDEFQDTPTFDEYVIFSELFLPFFPFSKS